MPERTNSGTGIFFRKRYRAAPTATIRGESQTVQLAAMICNRTERDKLSFICSFTAARVEALAAEPTPAYPIRYIKPSR